MDLIEWILAAAVERAAGTGEQVGHAQADNDRHQRCDKLEAAHKILCVLHDAASLMKIESENRAANGWIYRGARIIAAREARSSPLPTTNPLRYSNWRALRFRSDRYGRRQAVE